MYEKITRVMGFILPNDNDMALIRVNGIVPWVVVLIAKLASILLVVWFLMNVLEVKLSIKKRKKKYA